MLSNKNTILFSQKLSAIKSKRIIFLFFLLLLIARCQQEDKKETFNPTPVIKAAPKKIIGEVVKKEAQSIDAYFTSKYKSRQFNGCVLFAKKGKVVYNKAFGVANRRTQKELTTTSSFQLASVSKPFTALAILILQESNKLDLEDTIQKYIPHFPYNGITIKMLLCHRSGLPNYMYFSDEYWEDKTQPITNKDVVRLMIEQKPPIYKYPNKRYNYSNTGYMLLAHIVELISGESFEDFMYNNIFQPLEMDDSFIYRKKSEQITMPDVIGYESNGREAEDFYQNGVVGDKGVYTSVEDLFKLDQALYNNKLISETTTNLMYTAMNRDMRTDDNYGLGWRIKDYNDGLKVVYHGGWWKGFRTYFIRIPKEKKTIIILNSTANGGLFRVDELRALF